jgi:hypothetical protein
MNLAGDEQRDTPFVAIRAEQHPAQALHQVARRERVRAQPVQHREMQGVAVLVCERRLHPATRQSQSGTRHNQAPGTTRHQDKAASAKRLRACYQGAA